MRSPFDMLRVAALPLLWVAFACLMARDWWDDPYNPALQGTARYGHNHEGALVEGLVLTFVELAVLVGILRPWSYRRSWVRALIALVLLLPWATLWMFFTMHQGGVYVLHWFWLVVLVLAMGVTLFVGLFAAYRRVGVRR